MSEPKKRGRPALDPQRRRQNYTFRMNGATRDRVLAAMAQKGRSMSEELEARIEASFLAEDLTEAVRRQVRDEFAREALARGVPDDGPALPNMSDADRAEWLRQ